MQPEDIDKLFRDRLQHHAPAPPTHLWDQLEAELQPARKRPAMWLYAAAAVLALLIVAGGGWLWRGTSPRSAATLATTTTPARPAKKSNTFSPDQATAPARPASTPSEASPADLAATTAPAAAVTPPKAAPLATPKAPRLVARTAPQAPAPRPDLLPAPAPVVAAVAPAVAQPERPTLVKATLPDPEPTSPALVAAAAPSGPIVVDVRRTTDAPGARAYAAGAPESRGRLGRLLLKAGKQVGSAVLDGREVNLPRVELPEVVTAQVESWVTTSRP